MFQPFIVNQHALLSLYSKSTKEYNYMVRRTCLIEFFDYIVRWLYAEISSYFWVRYVVPVFEDFSDLTKLSTQFLFYL